MKDLSDNEFDRLFKEKSQNFDYEFEEEAWLLMEKKLRKKDRIIFFRNLSIAAALLLFLATGIYLFNGNKQSNQLAKKTPHKESTTPAAKHQNDLNDSIKPFNSLSAKHAATTGENALAATHVTDKKASRTSIPFQKTLEDFTPVEAADYPLTHVPLLAVHADQSFSYPDLPPYILPENQLAKATAEKPRSKTTSGPGYSLTFSAGPDFSSTRSLAGKRGNLNVGVLVNVDFKRFTLSTGARYGVKKYDAEALDYALNNPSRASQIYNIDASCNVLEIPVQLSVPVKSWGNKAIDINTGLSSYLMLKEKYLFEYTPESGVNDFLLTKKNANQSYFGVVSLSASYKFKPANQNIRFGIQPYVKLPLGGVGEGKVKLKSSGLSLTMTYGTIKKH